MRPLVVLGLVIVAVAALVFALLQQPDSGGRGGVEGKTPDVAPPPPEAAALDTPDVVPTELAAPGVETRTPADVAPANRGAIAQAATSYDNGLGGTVHVQGEPVAGVEITLQLQGMRSELAPLQLMMLGNAPPAPPAQKRVTRTDEAGKYSFRSVPPSEDYLLVVEHPDYAKQEIPDVLVAATGTTQRDVELKAGHFVLGYVWDHLGVKTVEGAELELIPTLFASMPALGSLPAGSYERITTVTRADGSYRIDNIPPGQNRTLICRAPGFGTMSATLEFKGQVERPIAQNFRMRPGLTISGRVIEQGGAPIPSASIDALFFGQGESARGNGKSVEGGRFEVADLAAGSYMLIATAEGFSDWRQNGIEAGTSNIEITLRRQGAISGRVLADDTGSPLRTFECSLRMSVGNQTPLGRTIKTQSFRDAEGGAFTLVGVETGTYVVQATALGYAPTLSDPIEVVDGRPTGDVLVRMTKGGSLVGRVVDPNGKPVKDARVSTQDNNFVENELMAMLGGFVPRNTTHATALTDSNGSYELALLSPGIYQVRIDHASYTKQVMNDLRVTEGSPVEVAPVRLTKGAVVRGRVYGSDGAPLQGAKVELRGPNPETRVPYADSTTTDNEGRYVITRVPSGSFTLHASNSLVANSADPFQAIIDMKRSETRIVVVEGKEYTQELYLGG